MLNSSDKETSMKVIDFGRSKILKPEKKLLELAGSLYYVAPEIVAGKEYDEKCDIWSAGIILYVLLSGEPPFNGKTKQEVTNQILKAEIRFTSPIWKNISDDAKNLIMKLCIKKPEKRINAHQARMHLWIIKHCSKAAPDKCIELSIENLRSFHTQDMLQKAVLTFIASQLVEQEQELPLRRIFSIFDYDKDGQITKEELLSGYESLNFNADIASREVDEVFNNVDLNKNGVIDYNEFIVANLKRVQITSEANLKEAFGFFDLRKRGYIDIDDLRQVFSGMCSDSTLQNIVDDADLNHDGKISYEEFKSMMSKYLMNNKSMSLQYPNYTYNQPCLLYTSPSPRDATLSRMPSSA
eukprot:TRINITY_DN4873_c0_g1_i1.p1 TRINITY_DN4873_c0_g1~~TRINITY_DN4873_c0_g1_i1.p1  ORF type:complete len:354 (-),score=73.68 TRINITY_DN4873_c0_g1_i1:9-1070(-)